MTSVTVEVAGVTVPLRAGETILAGLYRAGFAYRTGCRRGGCGVCQAEVTSGEVTHRGGVAADALPASSWVGDPPDPPAEDGPTAPRALGRSGGACLTCRAVPLSDVVIRLPDDARFRCVAPLLAGLAGTTTVTGSHER